MVNKILIYIVINFSKNNFFGNLASLSSAVTPKDNRIEIFVDDKSVLVQPGITVLQVKEILNFI